MDVFFFICFIDGEWFKLNLGGFGGEKIIDYCYVCLILDFLELF